jgi:hypothetical protein
MSNVMNILKNILHTLETKSSPPVRDFLKRKLKRHIIIRSIRDFALPVKNIKVVYDSPIMGISAEEYCGVYEIKDLIVHSNSGLVFFERKQFGYVLIEESSKDYTDQIAFNSTKTDTKKLYNFNKANIKSYSFNKKVYLFFIRRNSRNFSHFIWYNLCPLLLLINNGYKDIMIIHQRNLAKNQMEYLEIIRSVYGIEYMEVPAETHFRITSPVILSQYPVKKFFRMFYTDEDYEYSQLFSNQKRRVTINRKVDFFRGIDFVGRYLPKDWKKQDKDFIWGKYQNMKRFASKTSTDTIDILVQNVLPNKMLENPTNDIVYITRADIHKFSNYSFRYVANEDEIIEKFPQMKVINLSELSQREIIKVIYNAKILIGLHGAGLIYGYFMRRSMVLIEIHPRYWRYPEFKISFKVMCEAKGLRHIGLLSSSLKDGLTGATYVNIDEFGEALELAEEWLQGKL